MWASTSTGSRTASQSLRLFTTDVMSHTRSGHVNVGTRLTKTGALAHLKTLDDVVEDYIQRFQTKFEDEDLNHSRGHDDPLVDFWREAPTLETAIRRACDGRRRDGKLFQKGSCV